MKIFFKKNRRFKNLIYLKNNLKGFTLTELLTTIAIFIIILGAVYSTYHLSQKTYQESEIAAELIQNGRVISEMMLREIRQAKGVVTELSDERGGATDEIEFQNGHDITYITYIHYFKDDIQKMVKREEIAYYFSISGDPADPETYVLWNSLPPEGETLATTTLDGPDTIGEFVGNLELWGSKNINISLTLEKKEKTIQLETKVFGRNL